MKGSDEAINPIVKSLIESIGVGSSTVRVRVRYSKPVFAQIFIGGLSIIDTPFLPVAYFRRIKKNAFQQNYQHSIGGRPSDPFVSFRVPPGTFHPGSYSTNSWASKRHVEVDHGNPSHNVNSFWNSNSKRQTNLPSTERQSQPGL